MSHKVDPTEFQLWVCIDSQDAHSQRGTSECLMAWQVTAEPCPWLLFHVEVRVPRTLWAPSNAHPAVKLLTQQQQHEKGETRFKAGELRLAKSARATGKEPVRLSMSGLLKSFSQAR